MKRANISYVAGPAAIEGPRGHVIPWSAIEASLVATNALFDQLNDVAPYVGELLGMRNLSAFVGAVFVREMAAANSELVVNPHQDGYPDLLLLDEVGAAAWHGLQPQLREKEPFSPFPPGGLEVKATAGDVPSARQLTSRGLAKPDLGDQRIDLVTSVNWKSHHRDTNYLVGLVWDFIEGLPAVVAVTFSNSLTQDDWGRIVQPTVGGGRTTSVSIMNQAGIQKMFAGDIAVIDEPRYLGLADRLRTGSRRPRQRVRAAPQS